MEIKIEKKPHNYYAAMLNVFKSKDGKGTERANCTDIINSMK